MKICWLFAGPAGCSKTPTATYLSCQLNLPIFNNDAIRTEVIEDFKVFDQEEYVKRRDDRLKKIVESGISFICDASIDREYKQIKELLDQYGYQKKIISFDLSREFLKELFQAKNYTEINSIETWLNDHNQFLADYNQEVDLHITDENFAERLNLSLSINK
jgi:predicted kinase